MALLAGCNGELISGDREVSNESSMLGNAGSGNACQAVDSADTTCNAVDDDCDGALDEDCDFGPTNCPAGYNRIVGTHGNDTLTGTSGRDCIIGYGGNDTIRGQGNDDLLVGGPGDDGIEGGTGDDVIRGGAGADTIDGGSGRDTIEGGDGNDRIDGGFGNDVMQGGLCHDSIHGGLGIDDLRGNDGSDRLVSARIFNRVDGGNGIDACQETNCEISLLAPQCTSDANCTDGKRCVVATGICVPSGSVAFTDPTCDGVDDDCDGRTDEEFAGQGVDCGVGACARTGELSCEDGEVTDSCTPGEPAADDATCDASDDDCDGQSDEDFSARGTTCGVGVCARTGTLTCSGGSTSDSCTPGTPAANDASCNGSDDDCNGQNDEDFVGHGTTCGLGVCAATGSTSCVDGSVHDSCTPAEPTQNDQSCNATDEDCDGLSDEHYQSLTTLCGIGACQRGGATSCVNGSVLDSCVAGEPSADTTCDGVDDDCDGLIDEHYVSHSTSCGQGACFGTGSTSCVDGQVQDSCAPGTPTPDTNCDAVDDDCDGSIDEHYQSQPTSCGEGACAATGSTSCVAGHEQDSCTPGAGQGDDPTCDGEDDDCDGTADEDFVSSFTMCGVGACLRMGATSCEGGVEHDSCSPGPAAASDFSCDGVDDDCSGEADEDYSSHATTCGVGSCGANGVSSCEDGVEHDNCTPGAPATSDPTCDGFDDDCDGDNDEDYVRLGTSCGTGACADTGATSCVNGSVQDSCSPTEPAADDASCNGSDDDCDGATDEEFAPSCAGTTSVTCSGGQVQMVECSDGNACTGSETCSAGTCSAGTPVNTDDGNPCTTDSCDPGTGNVTHTLVPSGTSCSDGDVCNGEELCLPGGTPGCAALPSDADSWWPAEGNANDILSGHNGTLAGGLGFTAGQVGQAFNHDGADDLVNLSAHATALNYPGQATIELWFRTSLDQCRTVFNLRQDSTHEQFLQIGAGCAGAAANSLVTWTYVNGATSSVVSHVTADRSALDGKAFHHLAVTFDGTTTSMYIDGAAVSVTIGVGTNHGDWGGFATPVNAAIGARLAGTRGTSVFFGRLDEVTLYDRPLMPAEIASIYMAGTIGKCTGGGPVTCTDGADAPAGTMCEDGGICDGAGSCQP